MDKIIKIVDENKNEIKSDHKICHRFQPLLIPYQIQTVAGVETKFDIRQIHCCREKCELWYGKKGMCSQKYNYIKDKEGEVT